MNTTTPSASAMHPAAKPGTGAAGIRPQTVCTYQDINWQQLWENARAKKSWKHSTAEDWSKRAESVGVRTIGSAFASQIVNTLDLNESISVLDVGCGPGTLALPLARKVRAVTAIDFAEGMVRQVRARAARDQLKNIRACCCAWEDDWTVHGITVHDIAIASRSLTICCLERAITKLNCHASHRVYIIERVTPTPFDPDAFDAVGRLFESGPDYIYTINTLYKMGIHPDVEQLVIEPQNVYDSMDEALQRYRWMFKELDAAEEQRLAAYIHRISTLQNNGRLAVNSRFPQRWAVLSWNPQEVLVD